MRVSIEEVLGRIAATPLFDLRWESSRFDGEEQVLRLVATSCRNKADYSISVYESFVFIKTCYTGQELSSFIRALIFDGSADLGYQNGMVWHGSQGAETEFDVIRVNSSQWYSFHRRKFPFVIYELPIDVENHQLFNPHQPVNGQGAPYFPTLQEAEAYYLLDTFLDNANPSRRRMQIVIDDLRAFFEKVVVSQNSLYIAVGGEALQDAEIKIHGKRPGLVDVVPVCGKHKIEIPLNTLPTELNVYLSVGDEILDHRVIAEGASIYAPTADVTVEREKQSDIEGILDLRGEDRYTEFKSSFSEGILKTICAFANTDGGSIFVGVTDEGEITGIADWDKVRLQIEDSVYDRVIGHVVVQYDTHRIPSVDDKKVVLEVRVLAAEVKPIALREQGKGERFYIRRDGTNRIMKRDDIVHLVNEQRPAHPVTHPFNWIR